jgi:hypothetical protein
MKLWVLAFASLVMSQCKLINLKGSVACPEYDAVSIQPPTGITTLQEFDDYVTRREIFLFGEHVCPNMLIPSNEVIRYANSFSCSYFVWNTPKACNTLAPAVPLVCKTSVDKTIADTIAKCPNLLKEAERFLQFQTALNNSNCYLGIGVDKESECGLKDAGSYCFSNPNDLCCSNKSNLISSMNVTSETPTDISRSQTLLPNPAESNSNSPESSQGSSLNITFVVIAAIGIFLILTLFGLIFVFYRRRNAASLKNQTTTLQKAVNSNDHLMVCVFEYQAQLSDELDLEIGDRIKIFQRFDDGWALGMNIANGQEGAFPFACVEPGISGLTPVGNSKRTSSIYQ